MPNNPDELSASAEETEPLIDDTTLSQLSQNAEDLKGGLTPEEIRDLGSAAATALSDPMWKEAFNLTLNEIIASWLQSAVHETRLRESLWHRAQNLKSLEAMLTAQVNAAQQVNLSEAEKAEQDLHRYEDIQGFGLDDVPGFDGDHMGTID